MKKLNYRETICLFGMIVCMISTDILICFDDPKIQKIGYICLVGVLLFLIFYCMESHKKRKIEDEKTARKVIENFENNKQANGSKRPQFK